MLKFVKGDFFDFEADIRINTVNCVGVMGAGVALAFKTKYAKMFNHYKKQCKNGEIRPGKPSVWLEGDMLSKQLEIINFPTKDHWRNSSKYSYIEDGLIWLSDFLSSKAGKIVTLPALGCGHGGLDWQKVKELIVKHLNDSPADILVFEPQSSKKITKESIKNDILNLSNLIKTHKKTDNSYPSNLSLYTEKNLYTFGIESENPSFDFAIISSTKPDDIETNLFFKFTKHLKLHNHSVILGGSANDKKNAIKLKENNIKTAVFLPTGINNSSEKMISLKESQQVSLLSIGNPFVSFDKKEYVPSTIARIFLSKNVLFTTKRLSWLQKHKKQLINSNAKFYYIKYDDLTVADENTMESIGAIPIKANSESFFSLFDSTN